MSNYTRRIYQTQALFVSPSATGFHFSSGNSGVNLIQQISRVQSISDGWTVDRQNISEFGVLAPIAREITETPTVNLSFSYLSTDGHDENKLGFVTNGVSGALGNILNKTQDEKNYFIPTAPQGSDLAGLASASISDVRGIGNAYISAYNVNGSVGEFLTADVTVEANNAKYDQGATGNLIPAINLSNGAPITNKTYSIPVATSGDVGQPIVIKQGDLTIDFGSSVPFGATLGDYESGGAHIQSFALSVPIAREILQRLGNKYSYAREITFPVDVNLTINAFVNSLTTGNLASIFCDDKEYDINIRARQSSCDGSAGDSVLLYSLKGAKLDSQSYSASIGPAQSVDLSFTSSIGSSSDQVHNLFISGSF